MTLVYLGCAWLLGIYLGSLFELPPWAPVATAVLLVAVSWGLKPWL